MLLPPPPVLDTKTNRSCLDVASVAADNVMSTTKHRQAGTHTHKHCAAGPAGYLGYLSGGSTVNDDT